MQRRKTIETEDAPAAIGSYSQAVRAGDLLFCSGQIPLDPRTGELVEGGAVEQAQRCLDNLEAVCRAAGARLVDAVHLTVYLADIADFGPVNEVYAGYFPEEAPARVAIGAAALPRGAVVEIDAIVAL